MAYVSHRILKYQADKDLWIKLFAFFVLGLATGWIGLLIGVSWIIFKSKLNKPLKVLFLVLGFCLNLFSHSAIAKSYFVKKFYKNFPEATIVDSSLRERLPSTKAKVYEVGRSLSNGSNYMIVVYDVANKSEKDIALIICDVLNENNKLNYTVGVYPTGKVPKAPSSKSCDAWRSK
jgi:hypothetical protein